MLYSEVPSAITSHLSVPEEQFNAMELADQLTVLESAVRSARDKLIPLLPKKKEDTEHILSTQEPLDNQVIEAMKNMKIARHEKEGYNKDGRIVFCGVGMRFNGNHRFSSGDTITLQREPDNPLDPHAIQVIVSEKRVAYVAKEDTSKIPINEDLKGYSIQLIRQLRASVDLELIRKA